MPCDFYYWQATSYNDVWCSSFKAFCLILLGCTWKLNLDVTHAGRANTLITLLMARQSILSHVPSIRALLSWRRILYWFGMFLLKMVFLVLLLTLRSRVLFSGRELMTQPLSGLIRRPLRNPQAKPKSPKHVMNFWSNKCFGKILFDYNILVSFIL